MEESEKRRERLRAMRMEAEQAEVSSDVESFVVPGSLSNPLLEKSTIQPVQESSHAAPRFDFYTDPMSAFSANKKRGQPYNHITQDYFTPPSYSASAMTRPSSSLPGPRNSEMSPSPAHQLQSSSPFDQRMHQSQGLYSTVASYRSPRGMASPAPMHQGTPESWNGSGGPAGYNWPSNASGGGQLYSPGFRPVRGTSFSFGQGRPQWYGHSPNPGLGRGGSPGPSLGRGRGRWYGRSMNSGLGQSGGRGGGFHSHGTGPGGRDGPECFYHKSMDEDPWQQLKPLIWKSRSLKSSGTSNSWLPKSISMKKARVSETSNRSSSQPSLAEYLAASFNEAVNDSPSS